LPGKNALAYCEDSKITAVKSFETSGPGHDGSIRLDRPSAPGVVNQKQLFEKFFFLEISKNVKCPFKGSP
jgi:hypothetical protein